MAEPLPAGKHPQNVFFIPAHRLGKEPAEEISCFALFAGPGEQTDLVHQSLHRRSVQGQAAAATRLGTAHRHQQKRPGQPQQARFISAGRRLENREQGLLAFIG